MRKTILFRLLSLVLVCGLLAGITAAFAQEKPAARFPDPGEENLLMIEGVAVTEESLEGIFSDGRIDYDFDTKVLTIREDLNGCAALALYSCVQGLTICVENDVTLTNEWGNVVNLEGNTTITGPGKLIVKGQGDADAAILVSGDATLTLEDCHLEACNQYGLTTAKAGAYPEEGGGGLIIRSSTVLAEGTSGAIHGFDGGIWLTGCEIKEPAGGVIYLSEGTGLYSVCDSGNNPATAVQIVPDGTEYHTVHFEMNGHGRPLDDRQIADGEALDQPAYPMEDGWVFGGWYTDAACTKAYDFSAPVTADLTLYAKWTEEAPTSFTDVPESQYYAEPVAWAVENEITNGTGGGKFSPDATCTRGQVVTFLWRAKGSPEPSSTENPFTDVKESDYFFKAVLWARESGITSGTSADKFSPGAGCTRAQVVTFLFRAENQDDKRSGDDNELPIVPIVPKPSCPFDDVQSGAYYYDAVLWAVAQGITTGTSATSFSPENTCTRGQIVTFLFRDLG